MFKKKHSQINIQLQNMTYSPFRKNSNCSPISRTPERTNLSPLKTHNKNKGFSAKSPRKQFINEPYSANKLPSTREVNFQTQLQFLGNTILSEYQTQSRQYTNKITSRLPTGFDVSTFSNISNYQNSDRHMKQSKKIFSNVLSKMNSEKKKTEATPGQCSVLEQSKPYTCENTYITQGEGLPIASFKALKQIKMIESIQPLPAPPQLQKTSSKKSNYPESAFNKHQNKQSSKKTQEEYEFIELVNQFKAQSKRDKIVELINQSFSVNNPNPIEKTFEQIDLKRKQAKILESMQLDESYEFRQLNGLLSKLEDKNTGIIDAKEGQLQSVKVSMQSAKLSLTMDPFL